ncbi:Clavaminate synthase-like protein, partial [Tilletiopsis washingtonensis]
WDLKRLCDEAGEAEIQAEAMRCTPETYLAYATSMRPPYADGVVPDESPLYLFDAQLPQRLGDNWNVPALLGRNEKGKAQEGGGEWDHDLFGLLGERRPDYRWVIAGPERSGSGWHKDPNATSAWNTILSGSKHWLFLPPHVTPPGVFVSHDEGEVTAPLSLAEWAEGYLEECRRRHGERGDGMLLEGRCEEGETVYVPTGWWHCVVNTSECVAFTQNLVSRHELGAVLDFMKSRPTHVSGFKRAPSSCAPLYGLFCARLREYDEALLEDALRQVREKE